MSGTGGQFSQDGSGPPNKRARIQDGPDRIGDNQEMSRNPLDNILSSASEPNHFGLPEDLLQEWFFI
jgi:hypothetical protein